MGWESERIVVVDGDLGVSDRDTHARESDKELVARVCLGEVGAIFGLEVSRLARNNADLLRLLEFCALTDTLVLDTDEIYDVQDFNDRLLLGLKAQMSEAELHVMAGRLQGAKRAAAERGELRFGLPVGFVYDEDGLTIIDPDEEVQAAIADVFAAFLQAGSAYGVLGAFKGRRVPEARVGRGVGGRVAVGRFEPLAGGADAAEPVLRGGVCVRALSLATGCPAGWDDHHRDGRAAALRVAGADPRPSPRLHHLGCVPAQRAAPCRQPHARGSASPARGWRAVSGDRALWRVRAFDDGAIPRHGRALRLLGLADQPRADPERAFHACEPENRLVARSLETRWEAKLRELAEAEAQLAERTAPAPEPSREQLEVLARDVPALWAADSTSEKDRKRLLRALIADVTITSQPEGRDVQVGIRWRSGAAEQHTIQRPPSVDDTTRTPPERIEPIKRLARQRTNTEIAAELNARGPRTGKGLQFDGHAVRHIRRAHHIPATPLPHPGGLTVDQVADRLGISPSVIYDWISHDKLAATATPATAWGGTRSRSLAVRMSEPIR